MKKTLLFLVTVMVALVCGGAAQAQTTPNPEPVRSQKAVYDSGAGTVVISGTAPSYTEYDWDYYVQYPLDHISYIDIFRHTPGTDWPEEPLARVTSPAVGQPFSYSDTSVETDKKYEYKLIVGVDDQESHGVFCSVYTGVTPGELQTFTATVADYTSTTVSLAATAPLVSDTGAPLTGTMSIVFQQKDGWDYTTLQTIDGVRPGQTVTWQHTGLTLDTNCHYTAYALIGEAGKGLSSEADVYVGLDRPAVPTGFTATAQGSKVSFAWEAPTKGERGGCIDPSGVTYTLRMKYNDGSKQTVAEGISATTYEYTVPGEETTMTFSLVAVNATGESIAEATSGQVTAGTAATLPFNESFAGGDLTHKGWQKATTQDDEYYTYDAWEFVNSATLYYLPADDYIDIPSQDGDNGFASCKFYGYSEDGQTESLISPRIATTGERFVEVSFYYQNMCEEACKNEVKAYISRDGGAWQQIIGTTPTGVNTLPLWERESKEVSTNGAADVRIKIDAIRHEGPVVNVYIDNVAVIASDGTGITAATADEAAATTEYFTTAGVRVSRPTAPGTYIVRCGKNVKKVVVK